MVLVVRKHVSNNNTIGFIPTMGALHEGHLSLIQRARKENDIVAVSIFVNPKQFSNAQDLKKYSRNIEKDKMLIKEYVDILFAPSEQEMYPSDFHTSITVGSNTNDLEGKFRPGYCEGMATVVCKLINICQPTHVYMGLKDYQQHIIVSQMIQDLNMSPKIIGVPTIRESSGLAMSSRNVRLSDEEKNVAARVYKALSDTKNIITSGEQNPHIIEKYCTDLLLQLPKSKVEYVAVRSLKLEKVEKVDQNTVLLVALYVGSVRLIDNIIIKLPNTILSKKNFVTSRP